MNTNNSYSKHISFHKINNTSNNSNNNINNINNVNSVNNNNCYTNNSSNFKSNINTNTNTNINSNSNSYSRNIIIEDDDYDDEYDSLEDMEFENFQNNSNNKNYLFLNNKNNNQDNESENSDDLDDLDDLDFEFGNGGNKKQINNSYNNNNNNNNNNKNNNNIITPKATTITTTINSLPTSSDNNNNNNNNTKNTTPLIINKIDENDLLLISRPTTSAKILPTKTPLNGFLNNTTTTTTINTNSNNSSFSSVLFKNKSSASINTPKQKILSSASTSATLASSSSSNNESIIDGNIIKNKIKSNNSNNNNSIVTIFENKTREIGYSSYNQETGEIETGQFCDSQTYFHLYNKLFILNPSVIVIPPIEQNIEMVKLISSKFPNAKIIPIVRKLFNENEGFSMIRQLCLLDKLLIMEKFIKDKILSQSSFSALIKYLEQEITFVKNCVRIKYSGSENSMHIDAETIKNLELIHSSKDGTRNCTLYDAINYTKTSQGSRLLISAIVQPSNDIEIIRYRQNAIKQLLTSEKTIYTLLPILSKIQDIDKILLLFSQQSRKVITIKSIENFIKNFIEFKNIFELLPKIFNLLNDNVIKNNALLKIIRNNLSNQIIEELYGEINKVINSKVPIVKNQVNTAASKIISYIKDGVNGLLDVCKKTYKEIIQDIGILLKYYQDQYKIPQLKLHHCLTKGYYFSLPCKNKNLFHLPSSVFIRQTFRNQKCYFFSEELSSLSRRCKEVFEEIIILSAQSIERLIEFYRARISELYNLSESISLLDFLVSGALYSLGLDQSACPEIFESGGRIGSSPLAIKSGYHPLQLRKSKKQDHHYHVSDFVPNDTLINETSCFQLIHGCNMSGKSTYIQQVALLTILGHIGYFLPAEFATIPIVDQIISRLGTSDNIQSNASTFMTEMKEISYILENATENSLVIIDELGRGTSNMDGSSIAWAISENLSQNGCFTLFVTHYQQLLNLATCYPNIRIYHFQVSKDHTGLKYNYLLSEGSSDLNSYGIDTAELAGIDEKVIQSARFIRNILESSSSSSSQLSKSNNNQYQHPSKDSYQLLQKLLNLKHSKLTDIQLKDYLTKLKNEFSFN